MNSAKFLGTSDEVTTCECCGRKNLKSTVAISVDGGDAMYFGVTCAAHALSKPAKHITSQASRADRVLAELARLEQAAAWDKAMQPWFMFLASSGTGSDTFSRIESLGGFTAARALFAAGR